MASTTATRLWRTCKAANRPWPVLDADDDVVDYLIMEAVAMKSMSEDQKVQKKERAKEFRQDRTGLDNLRKVAGG